MMGINTMMSAKTMALSKKDHQRDRARQLSG
jgi:hypothetical protein